MIYTYIIIVYSKYILFISILALIKMYYIETGCVLQMP